MFGIRRAGLSGIKNVKTRWGMCLNLYRRVKGKDLPHASDYVYDLEFGCTYISRLIELSNRNYIKPLSRYIKRESLLVKDIFKKKKRGVIYKKRRYN